MIYIEDHIEAYTPSRLENLLRDISEQRRAQVKKFAHFSDRLTCALAYKLLKDALKSEYGMEQVPEFSYSEHGKPFFASHPDIHFNLSHCKKAVACALSPKPIGIDVERIRPFDKELAAYVCAPSELETLLNSPEPELEFTLLWTKKEALCKLRGDGLPSRTDLQNLLLHCPYVFSTTVNREKGYVLTSCEEPPRL